jgi:serine/threonine-protein kinase
MSAPRVKPGDVLGGKYKVERILGVGGMGVVVAAKHIDLGQRVALKFMNKEIMSEAGHAERFLREAKAAVQLKSVHTARVLDVGRLKNGEPFMVMEYLEGRDLDAELQVRGPMPPHVAVDYILQATEALAEAHGLGMIHRDVKLKNLFLTSTVDGRPLVKVLDFGLAKKFGVSNDVSLTATSAVFGSPQYMSPEQMKSAKDVDFRSDIWSLGVCLYELLTGRVPYDAQGVAEICAMVLKDPVPPPSQFIHGIPFDLEQVVLQCLEKDVTHRYQSVAELGFALQNYSADEGSAVRILQVMQSAQKVEVPTLMTMPGSDLASPGKMTMNAWDSNLPSPRSTHLLTKPQLLAALGGAMVLAVIGLGGIGFAVKHRKLAQATPAAAVAAKSAAAPPAADPLPPPAPTGSAEKPPDPAPPAAADTAAAPATTGAAGKPVAHPKPHAPAGKGTAKPKGGPGSGADYM